MLLSIVERIRKTDQKNKLISCNWWSIATIHTVDCVISVFIAFTLWVFCKVAHQKRLSRVNSRLLVTPLGLSELWFYQCQGQRIYYFKTVAGLGGYSDPWPQLYCFQGELINGSSIAAVSGSSWLQTATAQALLHVVPKTGMPGISVQAPSPFGDSSSLERLMRSSSQKGCASLWNDCFGTAS